MKTVVLTTSCCISGVPHAASDTPISIENADASLLIAMGYAKPAEAPAAAAPPAPRRAKPPAPLTES